MRAEAIVKNTLKKYRNTILLVVAVVAIYAVMFAFGITCPIKYLTGISCPGCGMSRACVSALRLDFASAFCYHPLWIILPFAAALLILFRVMKKSKLFDITLYVCAAVMFCVWLYRMIFAGADVVVFEPQNSIIVKLMQKIIT